MDHITKPLLNTIKFGPYILKNRIAMCPLTRCRADPETSSPNEMHVKYYSERASDAGFIRTECAAISQRGDSFKGACGIWSDHQVQEWTKVCDECHLVKGVIFMQIWHCGRAGVTDVLKEQPLCPSNIRNRHPARTQRGYVDYPEPKEMDDEDFKLILDQFRTGAKNALRSGFDGIELHGANGYIIDQFLRDSVNTRTDKYGGSIENRCRFPLEVVDILIEVFGNDRVGVKLTPVGRLNDMYDSDPISLYSYLLKELDKRKILYVEIPRAPEFRACPNHYGVNGEDQIQDVYKTFRPFFNGIMIANNSYDFESGNKLLIDNDADMVAFGRSYIANPDLVNRLRLGIELAIPNDKLFYTPGPEGYIDYPKYDDENIKI